MNSVLLPWETLTTPTTITADPVHLRTVPREQKAALFDNHGGPIRISTLPVPNVEPDELLVCICFSGVCRMDLDTWTGMLPWKSNLLPLIGGHEGVGTVLKVGADVYGFKVGDRVGISWINGTCMSCEFCKRGFESNCPGVLLTGLSCNGTFCQYTTVKAMNAVSLPTNIDMPGVTTIMCEGLMVYRALKESGVHPGQVVAISGAGGMLGRLAIQFARAMGMRVMAIDKRETKEQICRELGAEFFIPAGDDDEDLFAEVIRLTDGGPHGAVNCAPEMHAVEQAVDYLRPRGRLILTSMPTGNFTVDAASLVMKSIQIRGSYVGNRQDLDEAIDFFARGLIESPAEVVPLSELSNVYERMRSGHTKRHIVLDLQNP